MNKAIKRNIGHSKISKGEMLDKAIRENLKVLGYE